MKKLIIKSGYEQMIIEPLNMFRCVHISLKDCNMNEWNDFMLDLDNLQEIVDFLNLQIKKAKKKKIGQCKDLINKFN